MILNFCMASEIAEENSAQKLGDLRGAKLNSYSKE